ncbi:TetR/AcrR family transcriptional regulator C-terminal domain-containing protein [Lacisediminihabitans sp.]|uniref:TetR/AcrR family transcriptional regulator C-terminal domain-containing protein n=1 Tax=Lacisediminihabitans sp. TaxID=2787631 RepID=UPI00374CFCF7
MTAVPRSAQIAAELRAQIESGGLGPGMRVPSTRDMVREWGVAMATATKALSTLRQAGLVHSVPGIGTVVGPGPNRGEEGSAATRRASAAAPARHATATPTTEVIVAAAIAIADAEGLAGVSMRRVAAQLGVGTMSLYRHVADKDDLLVRMMDAVLRERMPPEPPPTGWRARLELAAGTLWATFHQHMWLAPVLSVTRPQPIASGMTYLEFVLEALVEAGLTPRRALGLHLALVNYVRGTALNLELEADAIADSGQDARQWMDAQEPAVQSVLSTTELPVFERLDAIDHQVDLDSLFDFGLQRLLDGFAVDIALARGGRRS